MKNKHLADTLWGLNEVTPLKAQGSNALNSSYLYHFYYQRKRWFTEGDVAGT